MNLVIAKNGRLIMGEMAYDHCVVCKKMDVLRVLYRWNNIVSVSACDDCIDTILDEINTEISMMGWYQ